MVGGFRRVPPRLPLSRVGNWLNQIAKDGSLIPHDAQPSAVWGFGRGNDLGNRLAEPRNQYGFPCSPNPVENRQASRFEF